MQSPDCALCHGRAREFPLQSPTVSDLPTMAESPSPSAAAVPTRPEWALGDDPLRDLVPLRRLLGNFIADAPAGGVHAARLNGSMERLNRVRAEVNSLLCGARLPLPPAVRTLTLALRDIQALAVAGLEAAMLEQAEDSQGKELLLDQLLSQLVSCSSINTLLPSRFWIQAIKAYAGAEQAHDPAVIGRRFNALLTTAVVQPESFAPWELIFITEIARRYADRLIIQRELPADPRGWFWLDESGRFPPMSLAREHFALHNGAYFFCFDHIIEAVEGDLEHPTPDADNPDGILPDFVANPQCRTVLNRALSIWRTPLQRKFPRRRITYRVWACIRLGELWQAMSSSEPSAPDHSEWMVVNESANGIAIMHIDGDIAGLTSGGVIGLRMREEGSWKLGIVRWIRSENSVHVELGIELIAPEIYPVRIVPENSGAVVPLTAMVIPASTEEEEESLVITGRNPGWHNFTLLTERGGNLRLTSCRFGRSVYDGGPLQIITFTRLTPAG